MNILTQIAERKIAEAMEKEDITPKGWKNRPLPLQDDSHIPEDMRIAYKMLKNSGYLPPELENKKEIHHLEELIARTEDENERLRQMKKLHILLRKIDATRSSTSSITEQDHYYRKLVERITVAKKK